MRRPYLVLTRQAAIEHLHVVIAVPATRTVRHIPTEVALDVDDGVPQPCALSLDNLTAMPKAFLVERGLPAGHLEDGRGLPGVAGGHGLRLALGSGGSHGLDGGLAGSSVVL